MNQDAFVTATGPKGVREEETKSVASQNHKFVSGLIQT